FFSGLFVRKILDMLYKGTGIFREKQYRMLMSSEMLLQHSLCRGDVSYVVQDIPVVCVAHFCQVCDILVGESAAKPEAIQPSIRFR
ncbi:MAG: hypothetical protein ACKOCH_22100, partial [Bacteroidota bacterium]